MYDQTRYNIAQASARRMTDAELLAYHRQYMREDGQAIQMGGRGLVDSPEWSYIKQEMRNRGLEIPQH